MTVFFFLFFSRYTMPSIPSMHVAPMNWASQPTRDCVYLSSRTWMATVTGGWGRPEADEATCLPTIFANQNIHEQFEPSADTWDCTAITLRAHTEQKGKRASGHMVTYFLICCHGVWKWKRLTSAADSSKLALYAYIYRSFYIIFTYWKLHPTPSRFQWKTCELHQDFAIFSGAEDNEWYA